MKVYGCFKGLFVFLHVKDMRTGEGAPFMRHPKWKNFGFIFIACMWV